MSLKAVWFSGGSGRWKSQAKAMVRGSGVGVWRLRAPHPAALGLFPAPSRCGFQELFPPPFLCKFLSFASFQPPSAQEAAQPRGRQVPFRLAPDPPIGKEMATNQGRARAPSVTRRLGNYGRAAAPASPPISAANYRRRQQRRPPRPSSARARQPEPRLRKRTRRSRRRPSLPPGVPPLK